MNGGTGDDLLIGEDDEDTLNGDGGNDRLEGGAGRDRLDGGADNDELFGQAGDDILTVGVGDDLFHGGSGFDRLDYSGIGNGIFVDLWTGVGDSDGNGSNEDRIFDIERVDGTNQGDTIYGSGGGDEIRGNGGNDIIATNRGSDIVYGGDGDDILWGRGGNDQLTGGAGADSFMFRNIDTGVDRIRDFNTGENDRIDISDLLTGYNDSIHALTDFVRITDDGTHSYLAVDRNGGGDSFSTITRINNTTDLTGDEAALVASGNLIV